MGSLCIIISRPLRCSFGEYSVHHGKLNLRQLISDSSGSRAYIFIISGVTPKGPEEVYFYRRLTYLMFSSKGVGWAWSLINRVIVDS